MGLRTLTRRKSIQRIAEAMNRADGVRPLLVGAHLEGPFLGGAPGAHPRRHLVPVDLAWLSALPDHVAVVTLAPEQPDSVRATEMLVAAARRS